MFLQNVCLRYGTLRYVTRGWKTDIQSANCSTHVKWRLGKRGHSSLITCYLLVYFVATLYVNKDVHGASKNVVSNFCNCFTPILKILSLLEKQ